MISLVTFTAKVNESVIIVNEFREGITDVDVLVLADYARLRHQVKQVSHHFLLYFVAG